MPISRIEVCEYFINNLNHSDIISLIKKEIFDILPYRAYHIDLITKKNFKFHVTVYSLLSSEINVNHYLYDLYSGDLSVID